MSNRVTVIIVVLLAGWLVIRVVAAERVSEPAYIVRSGNDYIEREWNYRTRFEIEPNPLTFADRTTNFLKDVSFKLSRPLFRLENKLLGRRIEKGDPSYAAFMKRLDEIRVTAWDYVVSPKGDGSTLLVVKNGSIVQRIE